MASEEIPFWASLIIVVGCFILLLVLACVLMTCYAGTSPAAQRSHTADYELLPTAGSGGGDHQSTFRPSSSAATTSGDTIRGDAIELDAALLDDHTREDNAHTKHNARAEDSLTAPTVSTAAVSDSTSSTTIDINAEQFEASGSRSKSFGVQRVGSITAERAKDAVRSATNSNESYSNPNDGFGDSTSTTATPKRRASASVAKQQGLEASASVVGYEDL